MTNIFSKLNVSDNDAHTQVLEDRQIALLQPLIRKAESKFYDS